MAPISLYNNCVICAWFAHLVVCAIHKSVGINSSVLLQSIMLIWFNLVVHVYRQTASKVKLIVSIWNRRKKIIQVYHVYLCITIGSLNLFHPCPRMVFPAIVCYILQIQDGCSSFLHSGPSLPCVPEKHKGR